MAAERPPSLILSRLMLGAGFVLLAGLVFGAYALSVVRETSVQRVQRAEAVRRLLTQVKVALLDAETGQRGYLLTGDPAYLEPYRVAQTTLPVLLRGLQGQLTGSVDRARRVALEHLVDAKQAELRQTLADYAGGRKVAALAQVRSNHGMHLMDRLRLQIRGLQDDRDREIVRHRAEARRLSRWLLAGEAATAIAIVALATLTLRELSRRHGQLVRTRDELLSANHALTESMQRQAMLEEAARQSRKMEALGALTGGMAHDFNNMLAVVLGNLELLDARIRRGNTDVQRYIHFALDGVHRAGELTRRLLAFARKQPLQPERISLGPVVSDLAEVLRRTLGGIYSIDVELAPDLWPVVVDVNQLQSALLNLAVNAREAMPGGGRLVLASANVLLGEEYASGHADVSPGAYVMLAVKDEGHGMTPEVAQRAFDPFFTTKEVGKGTGLGLSQVYGFVKQSGGDVRIDSEQDRGTTVRIYLPRAEPAAAETGPVASPAEPASAVSLPQGAPDTTILLVEDDPTVRVFTAEALGELGYSVATAPNGQRGLDLLASNPGIRLLLTDMMMPGMNGGELARRALEKHPALRVMYMTGYSRDSLDGLGTPESRILIKPFSIEALASGVHEALGDEPIGA